MSRPGRRYRPIKTHDPQPPKHRAKHGGQKIAPGMYLKDGQVDVYTEELLAHFGWADTEENRDLVTMAAQDLIGQFFKIPQSERHVTHGHQCPTHNTFWLHEGLGCGQPRIVPCGACLS